MSNITQDINNNEVACASSDSTIGAVPFYVIQTLVAIVIAVTGYALHEKAESIKREQQLVTKANQQGINNNAMRIKENSDRIYLIMNNVATKDDLKQLKQDLKDLLK